MQLVRVVLASEALACAATMALFAFFASTAPSVVMAWSFASTMFTLTVIAVAIGYIS